MRSLFFISFILIFFLSAFPVEAAKVKAVNLEQLVENWAASPLSLQTISDRGLDNEAINGVEIFRPNPKT